MSRMPSSIELDLEDAARSIADLSKLPATCVSSCTASTSRSAEQGRHLDRSWENVDYNASSSCKSRSSSSTSNNYKSRQTGLFHKVKFPLLFNALHGHESVSPRNSGYNKNLSQRPAIEQPTYTVQPEDLYEEAKSNLPSQPAVVKRHPQIQRMRLTASESEATSTGVHNTSRPRSSTSLASGSAKVVSPSGSSKELAAVRPKRKALSTRSIGIVSGEDFVLNASNSRMTDYMNSAWNNFKYGWNVKPKVKLSLKSPIWLLGHCYTVGNIDHDAEKAAVYSSFLVDFRSRLWFTYRRELPKFAGTSLTTDSGWGCMLRSGQMMLAQALVCHFLGREWRWKEDDPTSREKDIFHRQIIRWCGDGSAHDQLFGLHKLVAVGQKCGKRAGDWYGPASLAHILQKAMLLARNANPLLRNLRIYVSQDCTIYQGDVLDIREKTFDSVNERDVALIILVAVRLGGHRINSVYLPCVKDLMTLRYSLGIVGGRPKHSLYFLGWQDKYLVHVCRQRKENSPLHSDTRQFLQLDPHFCQPTIDMGTRGFLLDSFHCSYPRRLAVKSMDPSCTLGFYCRNTAEYEDFVVLVTEVQSRYCRDYPIFTFAEGRLSDYEKDGLDLKSFEAAFSTLPDVVEISSNKVDRFVSGSTVDALLETEYVVL